MGFGPVRSPAKGLYRSPTKSILLSLEPAPEPEPGPPGGEIFHFAFGVSNKVETPEDLSLGPACGWNLYPNPPTPPQPPDPCEGQPSGWCPSVTFDPAWCRWDGTGAYQIDSNTLALLVQLNPANFPITLKAFDDTEITTIPILACQEYQQGYTEVVNNDEAWAAEWNSFSEITRFEWCGLQHTTALPDVGEDTLTIECTKAFWTITDVDEGLGRIYFEENTHLKLFDRIQIVGATYEVIDAEPDGLWVDTFPSPTLAMQGEDALFIPGIYTEKGEYTSVTDLEDGTVAMNVGPHNVEIGWVFTAWGSNNYFEDYYEVLDVTETTIVIEEFWEDEAGQWGAGPNVYEVPTYP